MMRRNRSDAIIHFAGTALSEENQMSIFPTTILLATDGSSEAQSATQTAVDLGQKTDSELHVVHVLDIAPSNKLYPDAIDPEGVELPDPLLEEELELSFEQRGRELLDAEVERVHSAGGAVAQAYLMLGEAAREIVHLAEDVGGGSLGTLPGSYSLECALKGRSPRFACRIVHSPGPAGNGTPLSLPTIALIGWRSRCVIGANTD